MERSVVGVTIQDLGILVGSSSELLLFISETYALGFKFKSLKEENPKNFIWSRGFKKIVAVYHQTHALY